MPEVFGNTTGLAPRALNALERIYRRRVPLDRIATPELVRSLVEASRVAKRQVGALVHRSGQVDTVVVGTASGLLLPDIGRLRAAEGRFRALRLVHTHLFGEPLSRDDLVDLTRLRLDLVAAILLAPDGEPRSMTWAYNTPPQRSPGEPFEIVGPIPYGHPQPHFGELMSSLEEEFQRQVRTHETRAKDGRALLIHVGSKRKSRRNDAATARLNELQNLAHTAGVDVVDRVVQMRDRIDPKLVMGRGKLEEVVIHAIELDVETLIFDRDLTPAQVTGITSQTDLKVIDRSQLILDIFAQRAESRDGKLQVELAQLKYRLPKLGTRDDALSRLTGGIGGRGPGETKLEIGRRRARERIHRLERELKTLARRRAQRRRRRHRDAVPVVAVVGYTNAGKSTLLNTLTNAAVLVENRLFATLDPRARQLHLPGGTDCVLTDTVGFIRDMPRDLFAAFRATFEETVDANLLLVVVDAADPEHPEHLRTTGKVLDELGLDTVPRLTVYNKLDLLDPAERAPLEEEENSLTVCAHRRETLHQLAKRIEELIRSAKHSGTSEHHVERL